MVVLLGTLRSRAACMERHYSLIDNVGSDLPCMYMKQSDTCALVVFVV
jgi:hypothetical protein